MTGEIGITPQVGEENIASPCIRICCLDDENVCLGCFRTLEEIKNWTCTDKPGRTLVLQHCAQRREAHDQRFPGLRSPDL